MYFYFTADYYSAIKLNGAYLGMVFNSQHGVNIDENSETLVEICDLSGKNKNLNMFIGKNFDFTIPDFASLTDLKGGYLIKFYSNPVPTEFKMIAQEKYDDLIATAFTDNGINISVETRNGIVTENVKNSAENLTAEIIRKQINNCDLLFFIFGESVKTAYVFNISNNNAEKITDFTANEFSFDSEITATVYLTDVAKHTLIYTLSFDNGTPKFLLSEVKDKNFDKSKVPIKILPYAFFEEVQVGGDFIYYLSDGLKENANKLKEYLGDYLGIMPPPAFRNIDEVGLIYKDGGNKYRVDYYMVEIIDGKINNVIKSEK